LDRYSYPSRKIHYQRITADAWIGNLLISKVLLKLQQIVTLWQRSSEWLFARK
jgi:hypothetical protein